MHTQLANQGELRRILDLTAAIDFLHFLIADGGGGKKRTQSRNRRLNNISGEKAGSTTTKWSKNRAGCAPYFNAPKFGYIYTRVCMNIYIGHVI